MYVIAGVTGHTGSVAANTLLAAKQPVRVIVRDAAQGEPWRAKGAEVAVADLGDREALTRALAGATGAYLLLPPPSFTAPGVAAERASKAEAIVGAVRAAKPGHVVFLSSLGAEHASGTGPIQFLHPIEEGLRASGVATTLLRAGNFMENWQGMLAGAIESGTLYHGIRAGLAFPQVATTDIGKTVAKLLVEGAPRATRVVQLAGPEELTLAETAAAIGKIAGKQVNAVSVPPAAVADNFRKMGVSAELASLFAEMVTAINDGKVAIGSHELQRGTVTLEQRLRELRG